MYCLTSVTFVTVYVRCDAVYICWERCYNFSLHPVLPYWPLWRSACFAVVFTAAVLARHNTSSEQPLPNMAAANFVVITNVITNGEGCALNGTAVAAMLQKKIVHYFTCNHVWIKEKSTRKCGRCECTAPWGCPTPRQSFSALITMS